MSDYIQVLIERCIDGEIDQDATLYDLQAVRDEIAELKQTTDLLRANITAICGLMETNQAARNGLSVLAAEEVWNIAVNALEGQEEAGR